VENPVQNEIFLVAELAQSNASNDPLAIDMVLVVALAVVSSWPQCTTLMRMLLLSVHACSVGLLATTDFQLAGVAKGTDDLVKVWADEG
jgi:hypothetical protein